MLSKRIHDSIYLYGLPLLLFLIPFNNVLCNILILVLSTNWLIELDFKNKLARLVKSPYILLSLGLFLLICLELCFTANIKAGHFAIEKKLSLLCFPLVIGTSSFFSENDIRAKCYNYFFAGTLTASLCLLAIACFKYFQLHDPACFFYHALVSPFHQHAVYFSVYIYISIVWLYQRNISEKRRQKAWLIPLLFLSAFIILLSSKLIIFLFLLHGTVVILKRLVNHYKKTYAYLALLVIVVASALLFLTKNPVKERFNDLTNGNIALIQKEKFETSYYFNAWQLRFLLWKFSAETLSENREWLLGVSPGDAQDRLNAKVRQYGMYVGDPRRGDYGYLHHNCHNQYIQTLLETGLLGLALFLSVLIISFKKVLRDKDRMGLFIVCIFCYFFLTESALERMMGIVPFFIFLSLLHIKRHSKP